MEARKRLKFYKENRFHYYYCGLQSTRASSCLVSTSTSALVFFNQRTTEGTSKQSLGTRGTHCRLKRIPRFLPRHTQLPLGEKSMCHYEQCSEKIHHCWKPRSLKKTKTNWISRKWWQEIHSISTTICCSVCENMYILEDMRCIESFENSFPQKFNVEDLWKCCSAWWKTFWRFAVI